MKITKSLLKQLIKEEIEVVLAEANAQTQDEYINSLSVEQEKLYDEYRELLKYDHKLTKRTKLGTISITDLWTPAFQKYFRR